MNWERKPLILLPILLCCLNVFQFCSGVRCYSCQWIDGMGERECLQDPPPSRFLTECAQPQCWKKYSHHNGNTNVQRYCVSYASDRSSCQRSTFQDPYTGEMIPAIECTCNSDGCNGSTNYHKSNTNYNGLVMMSLVVGWRYRIYCAN